MTQYKWSTEFAVQRINSSPSDKILALIKFKALADNKIIVTKTMKFLLGRIGKIVGKRENAGYQHFLPFPQSFLQFSFQEVLKFGIVWQWVYTIENSE